LSYVTIKLLPEYVKEVISANKNKGNNNKMNIFLIIFDLAPDSFVFKYFFGSSGFSMGKVQALHSESKLPS